jgi:hypothetical protein
MVSLEDIAAMKLNAIAGNGTRLKDFIDIATLSRHLSLKQMLDAYAVKYSDRNLITVLKSLNYFGNVNKDEPVQLLNEAYSWSKTEQGIKQMLQHTGKVFKSSPYIPIDAKTQALKSERQKRKGRGT